METASPETTAEVASGPSPQPARSGRSWRPRGFFQRMLAYFLLFLGLAYFSGRFIIETSLFKLLAEESLSARSGMLVSMGDVSPSSTVGWGLKVKRLAVMEGAKPLVYAESAQAELDLSAAMKGEIRVYNVLLSKARLNLVRKRDGRLNIGYWESQAFPYESIPRKIQRLLTSFDIISLEDCSLLWTDWRIKGKSPYKLKAEEINLRVGSGSFLSVDKPVVLNAVMESPKGRGMVDIHGKITNVLKERTKIGFEGRIKAENMDVGRLWPYLGMILPFQRLDLTAGLDSTVAVKADGSVTSQGEVALYGLDLIYREAYRQRLKANRVSLKHDVSIMGDSIAVRNAELEAEPLQLFLRGEAHKLLSGNPLIYVELDLSRAQIGDLKKYVPFKYLTSVQANFIEKNIAAGQIEITGLTFDGDLNTLERLDQIESYKSISGMLQISGLRLNLPGLKREFTGVNGEFILADNRLFFNDLTGRYGKSVLRNVTGMVDGLHEWPIFQASISAALDLEETRDGLAAGVAYEEFRKAISQIESVKGALSMDLSVAGDSERLQKDFTAAGKVRFSGVGVKSSAFSMPLSDMNGEVELDMDNALFSGLTWKFGSNSFKLNGSVNGVLKPEPEMDLTLESRLEISELARSMAGRVKALDLAEGTALAETKLTGGVGGYRHQTRADLTDADIIIGDSIFKRRGMAAFLQAEGSGKFGGQASVERAAAAIGRSEARAEGDILEFIAGKRSQVKVSAERLYFDDLDYYTDIFDNIESRGSVGGWITASRSADGDKIAYTGSANIEDGTFKLKVFTSPFRGCKGRFELMDNQLFLTEAEGAFGEGGFTMSGSANMSGGREFKLNAVTSALNLDDLFGGSNPDVKERPGNKGAEWLRKDPPPGEKSPRGFFDGHWDIIISSQAGKIGPLNYQDLDARIDYNEGLFIVRPFHFQGHEGVFNWEAEIRDLKRSINFTSKIDVRDAAMESFGDPSSEKLIAGKVNIRGQVSGHGRTWEQISSTLDGRLELNSGPGVIKRFNLLGKIFSLLNVSQYFKLKLPDLRAEGLPFNGITSAINLAGGAAYTDNLAVDSEAIRLTAVGNYDVGRKKVDMTIGALPFVTIDRVISSVPVVGEVLTGADKSFIGYYFKAQGPLEDPEINSVSLEALAEGVRGIFRRLMELPKRASPARGAGGAQGPEFKQ